MSEDPIYDVVVIGSGSSGGVVAARAAEAGAEVLLLEAGPDFADERINPPAWYPGGGLHAERGAGAWPPDPGLDWNLTSEPLQNGRRLPLRRGKLVGGTSMANTCIAVRPHPQDLVRWREAGAEGWTWDRLEPHFASAERALKVMTYPRERWLPAQELLVAGLEEMGHRYVEDLNGPDAWGRVTGPWPHSRHNEVRMGTLNSYIRAVRDLPNFTIEAEAMVDRVLFEAGRVKGVAWIDPAGRVRQASCRRAVVSAGAYGSPPILLRSGIGPAKELDRLGIETRADLPVGRHLMEHPALALPLEARPEFCAAGWPSLAAVGRGEDWWAIPMPWDPDAGIVRINFCLAWTDGPRGSVSIDSPDPYAPPRIDHGLQEVVDGDGFAGAYQAFRELLATRAFAAAGARAVDPDVELRQRLLEGMLTSAHPAGGCDIGSVVDARLSVRGVTGLTVADASVFPSHATNNPNLLCFAVGEMAAEAICR